MSDSRGFLYRLPEWLDVKLRWWDLRRNRIDETPLHRRGFVSEYSSLALWLPIPVLLFAAYGLPRWRGWALAAAALAAIALHVAVCRFATGRWLPRLQWAVLAGLAVGVWWLADPLATEPGAAPYRLIYGPLTALVLTLAMPASRWWAEWLVGKRRADYRQHFAANLDATQLFAKDYRPPGRFWRVVRAYFLVPVESLLLLAILPALAVLVAPAGLDKIFGLVVLVAAWVLLAAGHYDDRLKAFQMLLRQAFLVRATLVVSLVVIVLALTRVAGVSYVTTVLDQASRRVLVGGLAALYTLFWLADYWAQRAAAEVLLGLLHKGEKHPPRVPYRKDRLQLHGAGRFIAISERPDTDYKEAFEPYSPLDVFRRIANQLLCRARAGNASWNEAEAANDAVAELQQKLRVYAAVPALVLALVVGWQLWSVYQRTQVPGLVATSEADSGELFDLGAALTAAGASEPVYTVAVSGGGTRAALYAYSTLRALHAAGLGERIVLVSSVSGGSLANAYYGAFRPLLTTDAAWDRYRQAMAAPYIEEVLAAAGEWRFLEGSRLGAALTESFDRCLYEGELDCGASPDGTPKTLGDADLGLVFNSSRIGGWRQNDSEAQSCAEDGLPPRRCANVLDAGSRLVVTNVAAVTSQNVASSFANWPLDFDYVVVHDPAAPLTNAASLSANFPPIFSNAAVALEGPDPSRYWVTDGGAVENRGIVSLLLSVRATLRELEGLGPLPLPPLRVVVADASGFSERYKEDRGSGAKFGAARRLANKLIAELLEDVDRSYRATTGGATGVDLIYLQMPEAVISAFGTNWEMPRSGTLHDPRTWYGGNDRPSVTLDQNQLLAAIDGLFDMAARPAGLDPRVWEWVEASRHGDPAVVLAEALARPPAVVPMPEPAAALEAEPAVP